MRAVALGLALLVTTVSFAKDKDYQIGTYLGRGSASDGTYTNDVHCIDKALGGFTCSGDSGFNYVNLYRVKTDDGVWVLETYRQATDTMARKWVGEAVHLKSEKPNLLDALKPGDRVMFRIQRVKKLNGTDIEVYIPRADDPNKKEERFIGEFRSSVLPPVAAKPTDNVKAMCESGKLTPEQQAKLCQPQSVSQETVAQQSTQTDPALNTPTTPTNYADAMADARKKTDAVCGKNSALDAATRDRVCKYFCALGSLSAEQQAQYCGTQTTVK